MTVTITNKIGKPAKKHLETNKTRFPQFKITRDIVYNGIAVEIDDEDLEDFCDALEAAGYDFDHDGEEEESGSNVPRWPKAKPKFSKTAPILPKTRPIFDKTAPKLPRA